MKNKITLFAAILFASITSTAQMGLGTISGYTFEKADSTKVVPLTKVWIETASGIQATKATIEGRYKLEGVKPGTYNLYTKGLGFDTMLVVGVKVDPDGITTVDVFSTANNVLAAVPVIFNRVKIEKDIIKLKILTEDIENSVFMRNPLELLGGTSSEIQMTEGSNDIIIRGSRPGDAIYYIDGIKMTDMGTIPGVAIGGLEAYTGGIPAKYGDTTGGVVVLQTKGYFDLYYAWKARQ
jgi:hypothetical protein